MTNKTVQEILEFGIINIDKPSGPTSFQICDYVRRLLGLRKTSHFGTLDPKVTGVLPIALNRACKLAGFFLGKEKEYAGVMRVHADISQEELQKIINENFIGKIKQTPPKRSRVKRQEREREIKKFQLLEQDEKEKKNFLFLAEVQAGTYIRKLVSDLGLKIGGAHMTELRRIRAGIFSEEKSITLYELDKAVGEFLEGKESRLRAMLIPAEKAIKQIMPVVQVEKKGVKQLLTGKPIFKKDLENEEIPESERFAVFFGEQFIEIAKRAEEPETEIVARPEFVLQPISS